MESAEEEEEEVKSQTFYTLIFGLLKLTILLISGSFDGLKVVYRLTDSYVHITLKYDHVNKINLHGGDFVCGYLTG